MSAAKDNDQAYVQAKIDTLIKEQEAKLTEVEGFLKNPFLGTVTRKVLEKQKEDIEDRLHHLRKQ